MGWPKNPPSLTLWQMLASGEFLDPLVDKVRTWGSLLALWPRFEPLTQWTAWYKFGIVAGMAIAALLTAVRIGKFISSTRDGWKVAATAKPASVEAKTAGKWKAIPETQTVLAAAMWLATGWAPLLWFGVLTLWLSLYFAVQSLASQIDGIAVRKTCQNSVQQRENPDSPAWRIGVLFFSETRGASGR